MGWANFFGKILSGIPSECQTFWIQISLGPNCFQRLSADNTSRQRVNPPIKGVVRAYVIEKIFTVIHSFMDLLIIHLFMYLPAEVFEASINTFDVMQFLKF